jgi:hypothetical protein
MRAEVTADGGELTITLSAEELPVPGATDASLRAKLPQHAGELAEGILAMLADPPGPPGEPKTVHAVHVRIARVITETSVMLDGPRDVYA